MESARLLDAPAVDSALPADAMVSMSIALGRNRHVNGVPVFVAVCDLLYRNHFAGATALLGVDGTSHGERRRARFFGRNLDVPLAIVAVGTVAQMNSVFPALQTILDRPLLSVERVQLCKRNGVLLAEPGALSPATWPTDGPGWQKLIVHTSEATRHDGVPIHRALVRRLRESRAANGRPRSAESAVSRRSSPRGDALIQFGRQVPVMTVVVDTPANIMRSFEIVDELTADHGLVTARPSAGLRYLGPGRWVAELDVVVHPRQSYRSAVGQHRQQNHGVVVGVQAVSFMRDHQVIPRCAEPLLVGGEQPHAPL